MAKVLIVDDSAPLRAIISRVLRLAAPELDQIVEAGDGVEALARLERHHDVELVLCDVHMPELDGIGFLEAVRERCTAAELPVVIVTADRDAAMHAKAIEHGANACITKPFDADSIRVVLDAVRRSPGALA